MLSEVAELVRFVRLSSGLSQRELAESARTTQAVIARIEGAAVSPGFDTVERIVNAAGFALRLKAEPLGSDEEQASKASENAESHMLSDVKRILSLSPAERLRELANAAKFFGAVRRV